MAGHQEVGAMSLAIIERLNRSGIECSVLTKGRLPAELADRRRFPCDNTYGISLVSLDEKFRVEWEPGAAPYVERIAALRQLHDAGRRTLVHAEPYPTPTIFEQDLAPLLEAIAYADHVYFSGWNYNPRVSRDANADVFYRAQSRAVRRFCAQQGIDCQVG
jgi:DNA repair photolyase